MPIDRNDTRGASGRMITTDSVVFGWRPPKLPWHIEMIRNGA
jgi:hypothetical protein